MFTQSAKDFLYSALVRCKELGLKVDFSDWLKHRCFVSNSKISLVLDVSYGDFITVQKLDSAISMEVALKVHCDLSKEDGRTKFFVCIVNAFDIKI